MSLQKMRSKPQKPPLTGKNETPKVLNKYKDSIPKGSVYIGRPGKWGNPFEIGKDGNREEVIAKHRQWVLENHSLIRDIKQELFGKDLVCFCAPKACHGDTLLEIANTDLGKEDAVQAKTD